MRNLDYIIEGVIQKNKAQIAYRLNKIVSVIGQAANDAGYKDVKVHRIDSGVDAATIEIALPTTKRQTMTVSVYDEDDVLIELPNRIAEILKIPNSYSARKDSLTRKELILLDNRMPPAVAATISKLGEIWVQLHDHIKRQ